MATSFTGEEASFGDYFEKLNLEYVERQALNFLVGAAGALVIAAIDYQHWKFLIKYLLS